MKLFGSVTSYALTALLLSSICTVTWAQEKVNPVVTEYGGIYDIPYATVKPDADIVYKIVIDVYSGTDTPTTINPALNNVARMLNLHNVGGVPADKMDVVLAIHGGATYAIASNDTYKEKYNVDNPNIGLVKALKEAGVRLTVCGQSLIGRGIEKESVLTEVEIATSMLTTVTMHQLKGYAFLKF